MVKKEAESKPEASKTKLKEEEECVFCKIARKELSANIVYESKNFIAFPDIRPRTEGHTVVATKKHYLNLMDMPDSLGNELVETIKKIYDIRKKEGAEGFNLLMNNFPSAGQFVMHTHLHVLPRKPLDGAQIGI